MTTGLTGRLWDGIADIYQAILEHPFITGLTDGTLPSGAFSFYVVQDALYLPRYAEALMAVGRRAPDAATARMFERHAAGAIAVEQDLHAALLTALGVDPAGVADAEPAPSNLAYTSHLLAAAASSYAEGLGAVLPCYWIYWEVGKELMRRGSPDRRYQRWIDTYGGDEFGVVVREALTAADELGDALGPADEAGVHWHFRMSSRYEWMFWDMGYRQERWPV